MSYFHLINEDEEPKQNIYVKNINMEGDIENAKIKTQNGDIVDLSSLPDYGLPSYRLTSNGNGSVSWVAGTGTSGIEYDGGQPVQLGKLAKYNATDGSLVNETSFLDTDILLKDGSVAMTGSLNMNNSQIDNVSSIKTFSIEPNPIDPVNVNIQSNSVNFNSEFVNCNGLPLKEVEWRFTRQGVNYGNFGTEPNVFFFGNFNNASVNTEIRGANNEKLVIDDSTVPPECRLENLNLDMTNNSIIDVFDVKTNNSVRTNIINANAGNAITLNPAPTFNVEVNSNLNMNFNDITEVNNIETLNISSSGVNITINDTIDANGNNIIGVNNISTDNISCNAPATSVSMQNDLDLNGNNIIGLSTINGIQASGGVYSNTGGFSFSGITAETDLLASGVSYGSKTVPANGFKAGDIYTLKIGGQITCANNDTFDIRIVSNFGLPSEAEFSSFTIQIDGARTNGFFEIEVDFSLRAIGTAGVAIITTNGDFTYYNNTNVQKGFGISSINNTTFNTTINNELSITYATGVAISSFQIDQASLMKFF